MNINCKFRLKNNDQSRDVIPISGIRLHPQDADKRVFSNEENRREKSLLIQKKNIKFGKKTINGHRVNNDKVNLTDYQTSQISRKQEVKFDFDQRDLSSILWSQNISVSSVENKKRLIPSRENAKKSSKDLNLSNTRKLKASESKESESNIIPIPISSNFMLFALKEVQKSARAEGSSTGRKSNKSGFEGLSSEERSKLRDLRSIFYKQTNLNKTSSEKTSARNRSSSKMLSKNSSTSFKNSRRSLNKKSMRSIK